MRGDQKVEYNKIVYNDKVLIDLTGDTVAEGLMLNGVIAHDKTGKVITGTFLRGYPPTLIVEETIQDSSGNLILDESSSKLVGLYIYGRK